MSLTSLLCHVSTENVQFGGQLGTFKMFLDTETGLYRLYWALCFSNRDTVTFRVDFSHLHTIENTIRDQPGSDKMLAIKVNM